MKLNPKPPFDFKLTATHMYLLPPARFYDRTFSRILRLKSGRLVHVSMTDNESVDDPKVFISVKPGVSKDEKKEIKDRVSFMFSLNDNLTEFYSIAKNDSVLKHLIRDLYGLKIQTTPTLFEGLVIGFCLQWTSFSRGVQMIDCLVKKYGERVNEYYAFPRSDALARTELKKLKECKLGFRAERIKWMAEKVTEGLNLDRLKSLPDNRLKEEVMKIKWVGEWTAEAILLWRFKRYNNFPLDVWSSKIFQVFYPELKESLLDDIKRFAEERWGKYKGLAYYYLMCGRKRLAQMLNVKL